MKHAARASALFLLIVAATAPAEDKASEEFEAPPLGHFVYLHARTQVANGETGRMILYDYDFEDGQLSIRVSVQLERNGKSFTAPPAAPQQRAPANEPSPRSGEIRSGRRPGDLDAGGLFQ